MRHSFPGFKSVLVFASVVCCATGLLSAQPRQVTEQLDLTGLELLPFGGEYLIAATWSGVIVNAEVQITLTTAGEFQAENFAFTFAGPTGGVSAFGATDFGWSGQGTFVGALMSEGLNGEIATPPGAPALNYWFMNMAPVLDSFPVPLEGTLGESFIRLTIQPCLVDWDGSFATGVPDIFAFLTDWFAGEPNADIDGAAGIGVGDIFQFLTLWFAGCSAF